jgi:hypothetical protein
MATERIMRALAIFTAVVALAITCAAPARAQTWSSPRGRPALWQISSVDRTGDVGWPYGREDVAGDGMDNFEPNEAGADLRTVYADADPDRLWIRVYVASENAPPENVSFYLFIDSDDRDSTGGEARDDALWPELEADPTPGGYDRAIAARSDGTLAGAWRWDAQGSEWTAIGPPAPDVEVEVDRDVDPIRIGTAERGYLQVDLDHDVSGLDTSCEGNVFVRVRHDDPPLRAFGDDDDQAAACRVPTDAFGDPSVLRDPGCDDDDDCPAAGRCREGVCLFGYDCSDDDDCRTGERCTGSACVRVVERECTRDADCDGLVCEGGDCAVCTESGARACASGLLCSPNGACIDPSDGPPGSAGRGGSGASGSGGAAAPGTTRGGAFECAAARVGGNAGHSGVSLLALGLVITFARVRRRWRSPADGRARTAARGS